MSLLALCSLRPDLRSLDQARIISLSLERPGEGVMVESGVNSNGGDGNGASVNDFKGKDGTMGVIGWNIWV